MVARSTPMTVWALVSFRGGVDAMVLASAGLLLFWSATTPFGVAITLSMACFVGTAVGFFDVLLRPRKRRAPLIKPTIAGRLAAALHGGVGGAVVGTILSLLFMSSPLLLVALTARGFQFPGFIPFVALAAFAGFLSSVLKSFLPTVDDLSQAAGQRNDAGTLTGADFRLVRQRLGLSELEMSRALGYMGDPSTGVATIQGFESGGRPIPLWFARLAIMLDRSGLPAGWSDPVSAGAQKRSSRAENLGDADRKAAASAAVR